MLLRPGVSDKNQEQSEHTCTKYQGVKRNNGNFFPVISRSVSTSSFLLDKLNNENFRAAFL